MRAPAGQLAVGAGVAVIGALILGGSFFLPTGGGYAQVGPGVVPRVVGTVLVILGAFLLREAFTGGFRGVDEEAVPRDLVERIRWVEVAHHAVGLRERHQRLDLLGTCGGLCGRGGGHRQEGRGKEGSHSLPLSPITVPGIECEASR